MNNQQRNFENSSYSQREFPPFEGASEFQRKDATLEEQPESQRESLPFEGASESQRKSSTLEEQSYPKMSYKCKQEEGHKIPFCCVISIPHGFELVPHCEPKIVYHLDCLATMKETCRKTVQVEDCGDAEVDIHILKVKGCIPFITNIDVEPKCEQEGCSTDPHHKEISISCIESVCIDCILKCSVGCLPDVHLDCHNVRVCNLEMSPFCDGPCQFVKITGDFQLISY
ncbi:ABC transporter permease [Bacillus thuringiensis]|uniref:ABC transporter permease n=1 Tax=Bacillus thuringiensis TaxID=1428 RepID=UPI0036E4C596